MPAPGLKVGVATFSVYVAVAVLLDVIPLKKALALIVVVTFTEMGLEYTDEVEVGSELLVVYRIVAPTVPQRIVTL